MFDVVGVGANSVDFVYRLPTLPGPTNAASKLRLTSHAVSCGGQVATALATCARMGLRAAYIGAVGDDENGRRVLSALEALGLDLSHVVRRPGGNQFAAILVDDLTGERVVLWDRPDSLLLSDADLAPEVLAAARIVLVDDVDPRASLRAAELARAAGVWVTTDLDHLTDQTEAIVRTATHPILAEHLPEVLTGETGLAPALRKLRSWNNGPITVTLGARGAVALDGDALVYADGFAVRAVDTTGAGDVFRGAFIHGVLRGLETPALLRWANAAAAISCTKPGALDAVPSLAEVQTLSGAPP